MPRRSMRRNGGLSLRPTHRTHPSCPPYLAIWSHHRDSVMWKLWLWVLKLSALIVGFCSDACMYWSTVGQGVHTIQYVLSACPYLPRRIAFALQKDAFSGFVGHGLVKGCFFEFVRQVMVKCANKGLRERCWSGDGQGRSKRCVLVK